MYFKIGKSCFLKKLVNYLNLTVVLFFQLFYYYLSVQKVTYKKNCKRYSGTTKVFINKQYI